MDDQQNERETLEQLLIDPSAEPIMLSYAVLRAITNSFSEEIGHGGFGKVYKGVLRNGKVAVKKLYNTDAFSEKQFEDELLCLIRVKHKNIVRFLGYCSDTQRKVVWHDGRFVLADDRRRYLCFEYAPNRSLDHYLKDESHRREWETSYQLIEGICQGLHYLHKIERITHLDLKPGNILLHADMVPKITDFGLSRRFSGSQSKIITEKKCGSRGYIAPELLDTGEISFKSDIFSLGIIIRNLLRWHQSLDIDCLQVKRCIKIAELCVDGDPSKRPTIDCIIDMLSVTETVIQMVYPVCGHSKNSSLSSRDQLSYDSMQLLGIHRGKVHSASETSTSRVSKLADGVQPMGVSTAPSQLQKIISVLKGPGETSTEIRSLGSTEISKLLDVHPLELRFPFEPNKPIQCPVTFTNRTDQYVGVWIRQTSTLADLHFQDTRSSYSLLVILEPHSTLVEAMTLLEEEQQPPPQDPSKFEVLMIVMGSESELRYLELSISGSLNWYNHFWRRVEELRGEVHRAMLTAAIICDPASCQAAVTQQHLIPTTSEFGNISCIDVHPTETWILVGHFGFFTKEDGTKIDCLKGYVSIWNYETQEIVTVLQVTKKTGMLNQAWSITSAKFIAREHWFATADNDGCVHVYAYTTKDKVKEFEAYDGCYVVLAVHPTDPFLLTGSYGDTWIKLWDWSKGWECTRRFYVHSNGVPRLMFNPRDRRTFASVSDDRTLKVWDIGSSNPITTFSAWKNVEYLSTDSHRHFLVTCGYNSDHNWHADIWDSQTRELVHTLNVSGQAMIDVACHPTLPLFVTLLEDRSSLCLWSASTYRLVKIIHSMNFPIYGAMLFTGTNDLTRLVVGSQERVAVMEINLPTARTGGGNQGV